MQQNQVRLRCDVCVVLSIATTAVLTRATFTHAYSTPITNPILAYRVTIHAQHKSTPFVPTINCLPLNDITIVLTVTAIQVRPQLIRNRMCVLTIITSIRKTFPKIQSVHDDEKRTTVNRDKFTI
jgi:hypothetical protein